MKSGAGLYYRGRRKKKIVKIVEGKKVKVLKYLPKGCKTAKRICIVCLKNAIHKLDSNYESKICKECS